MPEQLTGLNPRGVDFTSAGRSTVQMRYISQSTVLPTEHGWQLRYHMVNLKMWQSETQNAKQWTTGAETGSMSIKQSTESPNTSQSKRLQDKNNTTVLVDRDKLRNALQAAKKEKLIKRDYRHETK